MRKGARRNHENHTDGFQKLPIPPKRRIWNEICKLVKIRVNKYLTPILKREAGPHRKDIQELEAPTHSNGNSKKMNMELMKCLRKMIMMLAYTQNDPNHRPKQSGGTYTV